LESAQPFGVDVRSGIETAGRKDPQKMRAFVQAVREWR
jgi:phosphoribosylanthranilate isomerase